MNCWCQTGLNRLSQLLPITIHCQLEPFLSGYLFPNPNWYCYKYFHHLRGIQYSLARNPVSMSNFSKTKLFPSFIEFHFKDLSHVWKEDQFILDHKSHLNEWQSQNIVAFGSKTFLYNFSCSTFLTTISQKFPAVLSKSLHATNLLNRYLWSGFLLQLKYSIYQKYQS